MVLAVFGALLLAVMLGNQIARPLLLLADGVRQVAGGDLTTKPVFASRDELGGLTRSFAADDRAALRGAPAGAARRDAARGRAHAAADHPGQPFRRGHRLRHERRIDTVNPGATRILRQPMSAYRGRTLDEVPGMARLRAGGVQRIELHRSSPRRRARPLAGRLRAGGRPQDAFNLLLRGAVLPGEARLLVFDDITEVVSAAALVAWAEVARRLAHEIKNPLTRSSSRRAHRAQACRPARAGRPGHAQPLGGHHRGPGAGNEAAGQRIP